MIGKGNVTRLGHPATLMTINFVTHIPDTKWTGWRAEDGGRPGGGSGTFN